MHLARLPLHLSSNLFGQPHAMTEADILDVIERFAFAADVARETGFNGVEIDVFYDDEMDELIVSHETYY